MQFHSVLLNIFIIDKVVRMKRVVFDGKQNAKGLNVIRMSNLYVMRNGCRLRS